MARHAPAADPGGAGVTGYVVVRLGCGHPRTMPDIAFTREVFCGVCGVSSRASAIETVRRQETYGG